MSEVAWPLDRVEDVLRAVKDSGIAVLGGDVYEDREGRLQATYDNWHCEREPAETFADYAERSWKRAWDYIVAYPRARSQTTCVVLVLSDEPTAGL